MDELYKVERPKTFKAVVGNAEVKSQLLNWTKKGSTPHFLLFVGGSGMGKTTLARILKTKLKCGNADFQEINAAGEARGIETVRTIKSQMNMSPIQGDCRIYLFDEAHNLTKDAQNAVLKMLEDTPRHVYFIWCTTDPQKLLPTIRTRASVLTVVPLTPTEMSTLLRRVCDKHDIEMSEDLEEAIVEAAEGSARKALVLLNQVRDLEDDAAISSIKKEEVQKQAIELAKLLMNPRTKWPAVCKLIKDLRQQGTDEPEQLRWMMLGYATSCCLSGSKIANRAFVILDQFATNYYDTKWAGLVADAFEVVHGRQND